MNPSASRPAVLANDPNELLTREQIASVLSVCPKHVYRLCRRRDFPAPDIRLGRSPRWKRRTLVAWIERGGKK